MHHVSISPAAISRDPEGESRLLRAVAALSEKLYGRDAGVRYCRKVDAEGARVIWFDVPGSFDGNEIQITDLFRPFNWAMGGSPNAKAQDWRPIFAWMIP